MIVIRKEQLAGLKKSTIEIFINNMIEFYRNSTSNNLETVDEVKNKIKGWIQEAQNYDFHSDIHIKKYVELYINNENMKKEIRPKTIQYILDFSESDNTERLLNIESQLNHFKNLK